MSAYFRNLASQHERIRVFDWDKAAQLIKDTRPNEALAGLAGDWEYTGGVIFADGAPVASEKTYVYLASTWATPEIDLDGDVQDCWKYQDESDGWDADTYWPESALKILASS